MKQEECLRRDVNEYIYEALTQMHREDQAPPLMHAICECGRPCTRTVELELAAYREIRSEDGWRILSPDHDGDHIGEIIKRANSYRIAIRQPA